MQPVSLRPRTLPVWTLTAGMLLGLAAAPACSSDCEKYYTMAKKCIKMGKKKAPSKAEFVKECKKDETTRKVAAKCGKHTSCKKFIECWGDAFEKAMDKAVDKAMDDMEKDLAKKLSALLGKKKYEDLLTECFMYRKNLKPNAKKVCNAGQIAYVKSASTMPPVSLKRRAIESWCANNKSQFIGKGVEAACQSLQQAGMK